ncbi:MAG TPA: polymer-forming cytoskeletal protein [Verrucomicrobiae bacterium]|nr:polymer-forming cytoskeletal protein [Verrucomicrobiae bacterium]
MKSRMGLGARFLIGLSIAAAFSAPALATSHDRTQFGHDISIGPDEEVGDATCFGCSVRVRGHITSDVTVFGGSLIVEDQGQVAGDATVFGGGIRLENAVKVGGDVTVFGGKLRRDPGASVGGDITNFSGSGWMILIFALPLLFLGAFVAFVVWIIHRITRASVPATA